MWKIGSEYPVVVLHAAPCLLYGLFSLFLSLFTCKMGAGKWMKLTSDIPSNSDIPEFHILQRRNILEHTSFHQVRQLKARQGGGERHVV